MAGTRGHSGGWNRKSVEQHVRDGTYRRDRHAGRETPAGPVSVADRRRTLRGLTPEARRLAVSLLEQFTGWDGSSLVTLRAYVISCGRLEQLQSVSGADRQDFAREVRTNISLLKALNLEANR